MNIQELQNLDLDTLDLEDVDSPDWSIFEQAVEARMDREFGRKNFVEPILAADPLWTAGN